MHNPQHFELYPRRPMFERPTKRRFGSDDFPFSKRMIFRFPPLKYRTCPPKNGPFQKECNFPTIIIFCRGELFVFEGVSTASAHPKTNGWNLKII